MKSSAILSLLAAAGGLVMAGPTPTEPEQPHKRASLPTVTASGNGKSSPVVRRVRVMANELPQ